MVKISSNAWLAVLAGVVLALMLGMAVSRRMNKTQGYRYTRPVREAPIRWMNPEHPPQYDELNRLAGKRDPRATLVHMIYIPWDRDGILKEHENAFDQTFADRFSRRVAALNARHGDQFEVRLWKRGDLERFSELWCPGLWGQLMAKMKKERNHPVMLTDIYRWLLVYCYGGLYWQYQCELVEPTPMSAFLPSDPRRQQIKLFTETILTEEEGRENGVRYAIRGGEPEEELRIYTSIYYAPAEHPFVGLMLDEIVSRLNQYDARENYDILYITGNAVLPTVYARNTNYHGVIEVVGMQERDRMIKMSSNGSWRR
jgi:hypothetical protein